MRRPVAILVLSLAAAGAPAQSEDHGRVPMDPGAICEALRDSYAGRPVEERIIVSVTRAGVTRSEPVTLRTWPGEAKGPPALELVLGPLTVWSGEGAVCAVHQRDERVYFTAPIGEGGVLECLRKEFPPIPIPQIDLLLGAVPGCPVSLPYAPGLRWTDATVDAESKPARAHLVSAPDDGRRVELIADLEPPVLRWFVIDDPEEGLRIEGEVRRSSGAPSGRAPGVDVSGRRRVGTLAELAPVEGVLRVGDALPPMMVHPVGEATPGVASPLMPLRGPAVIVLFKEWTRDVPAALAAASEAVEGFDAYTVRPVAVLDLREGEGDARARVSAILPKIEPFPLLYSTAPERTIERVDPYAVVALIVVDERESVRMAERIDHFTVLDEPGVMSARITAAITPR